MDVASASVLHVHISPANWSETVSDIKEEALVMQEGSINSGLFEKYLKPIGEEFCDAMQDKGFTVECLGNMAAPKILCGKPVRATGLYLEDQVVRLLRDVYIARPNKDVLVKGLEKFVASLDKQPREKEFNCLVDICLRYLDGNESRVFGIAKNILDDMPNKDFSSLPDWGACYYLKSGEGDLIFPCVLLPPSSMYLMPSMESAMNGDRNWGPLLETKIQYSQPPLITKDFLEKLETADPSHIPPIVGSLPSQKHFTIFYERVPKSFLVSRSIVNMGYHKSVQASLYQNNIFIPATAATQTPVRIYKKDKFRRYKKGVLETLERYTD